MTAEIRRLRDSDDLEALTELVHRAYAPLAARGLRYWGTHQSVADTAERCARGETWVAERDGQIRATITFQGPALTDGAPCYDRPGTAENAPLAFGSSVEDDRFRDPAFVASVLNNHPGHGIYGHLREGRLLGMAGVMRGTKRKDQHRAAIFGMYVAPAARHSGAGRELLDACIARARAWDLEQLHLSVTDGAPAAHRLYQRAGFVAWGTDRRALQFEGRFCDEHHLVLSLRPR